MDDFLSGLFWLVIAVAGFAFAVSVVRLVWRLITGLMYVGGEAAEAVYETGDSDTHTLLKVIITILFPPLLILWIWKALVDDHRAEAPVREKQKEEKAKSKDLQKRLNREQVLREKAEREKRSAEWND